MSDEGGGRFAEDARSIVEAVERLACNKDGWIEDLLHAGDRRPFAEFAAMLREWADHIEPADPGDMPDSTHDLDSRTPAT